MANVIPAAAQGMAVAQAEEVPETVLITGSLIRGTAAVGVPVTNLSPQDFAMTGALTTADLFRTFPAANVAAGPVATMSGANIERATKVNIRGLDSGTATRSLMMIDGMRFPGQGNGLCEIDPSVVPALAQDHIDILVDGASATYGSDAIGGVINIILKRNMDGAITQLRYSTAQGGKNRYLASAIWGRTWDGGQVTLSYEWYDDSPIMGNAHSNFTIDFTPWGLDDRRNLGSSIPATLSTGAVAQPGGGQVGTSATIGHGCTNCYAVPSGTGANFNPGTNGIGPTTPFSASTLDWRSFNNAANRGTNGVRNQFNPYLLSWYDAAQQRNAAVMTIDQRLTKNISFYGEGLYSNRRAEYYNPSNLSPSGTNILAGIGVPTFNPYYPTGSAPTNLRVSYNMGLESPGFTFAYELADRYQLGLNIALPYGWSSQVWYAETYDSSFNHVTGTVNKAAVSAALGWTIGTTAAAGSTPALATYTKPASVPYLNLFCDATVYKCNSDTTLAYIQGIRSFNEKFWIDEKGAKADGPLFDLPGGTVKAAIGGTFTSFHFNSVVMDNTGAPSLIVPLQIDPESRQVWAVFTQVNIPIFSDMNGLPGLRRLEFEASWRHDQYSDVKGTSNPKLAFNWAPINDLTIRGAWGTSFRAPVFGELSPLANVAIAGQNLGNLAQTTQLIPAGCTPGVSLPPANSGAYKVMSAYGSVCPATSLLTPPGISMNGGSAGSDPIRFGGFQNWKGLTPELSTNWGIGFDYAPSGILKGLDVQATYYIIKLTNLLTGFGNPTANSFNDPQLGSFAFIVPTDYFTSGLPGAAGCTNNLLPTTCAPFESAVSGLIQNPRAALDPQAQTLILWINDGGSFNKGWRKLDGIDWNASYDWDWGSVGALNIGVTGTYYLHDKREVVPGSPGSIVQDNFHTTLNNGQINEVQGVPAIPLLRYRARLGWSNGPWSVTGFMDYVSHYFHTQSPPPDVQGYNISYDANGNPIASVSAPICATNGGLDAGGAGGASPCTIQGYSNIEPSWYTFDLSFGYNTMDTPSNEYLRNIGLQVVINNIMDRRSPFEYRISTGGGNPVAMDILKNNQGRVISFILTKQW
jgi:iron complex outermembrane receptor protein